MSWLKDPATGEVAKPLNHDELEKLEIQAGRRKQRRTTAWVVKRRKDGSVESAELQPIPKNDIERLKEQL